MSLPRNLRQMAVDAWPLVSLLVLILVASSLGVLGDEVMEREVILALIYLILVVSLFTFSGNSGVLSFGHIAFMAIGAYASGLLTLSPTLKTAVLTESPHWLQTASTSPDVAVLIGGGLAALFALLISIPLIRLSGLSAALATFAVLNIVFVVANNWTQITGGQAGLSGVPANTTLPTALLWALFATTAAYAFSRTRVGLRLRASRDEEVAARSIGVGVHGERRHAFVLSAFFAGIAGALFAQFISSFNAESFYLQVTFLTVAMLVVGGMRSLAGAVVGTIFISFVSAFLLRAEGGIDLAGLSISIKPGVRELVLAAIMLLVLVLRPSGLTGGREVSWPSGRRNRAPVDESPGPDPETGPEPSLTQSYTPLKEDLK